MSDRQDSISVELKTEKEIESLRVSGQLAAGLLDYLCNQARIGMTSLELDALGAQWIKSHGAKPAFLNYRGFPAHICVSVNDEVVHGIPNKKFFKDGDVVSIDVGLFYDGWCGDTARTIILGKAISGAENLLAVSKESLEESMRQAVLGKRLGDVSYAMQRVVESGGYNVLRGYGGHGIGRAMHEDPHVPCVGKPNTGMRLQVGMVLALEIMVNAGTEKIKHLPDGWTVKTADGALSAHFEHMVAISETGTEVLTLPPGTK